ncbi:MAG: hypothetical protein K2L54_04540, partial [Clostridiales bacterium]|nr:hypothetical protein [Clostridiales bacterium]
YYTALLGGRNYREELLEKQSKLPKTSASAMLSMFADSAIVQSNSGADNYAPWIIVGTIATVIATVVIYAALANKKRSGK